MSNPHQIAFYGKGTPAKPPLPNRLPPSSTLVNEMSMAGYDSKAGLPHAPYPEFEGAG